MMSTDNRIYGQGQRFVNFPAINLGRGRVVRVSSRGISNASSDIVNDGADFGPDTSGTTTYGIQEAINSLPASTILPSDVPGSTNSGVYPTTTFLGGGTVELLDGTFYTTTGITITNNNVTLKGQGQTTCVFYNASGNANVITIGDGGNASWFNIIVRDMQIFGSGQQLPGYSNSSGDGVHISPGGGTYHTTTSSTSNSVGTGSKSFTTVASGDFVANQPICVYETGTSANVMYGTVTSCTGTALVVNITLAYGSGTHTTWTMFNNSNAGVFRSYILNVFVYTPGGNGIYASLSSDNWIEDCYVENANLNGYYLTGSGSGTADNHIRNCEADTAVLAGFKIDLENGDSIEGCVAYGCLQEGILFTGGSSIAVTGCILNTNGQQTNNTYAQLRMSNDGTTYSTYNAVNGNIFVYDGSGTQPKYNISEDSTSDGNNVYYGNQFSSGSAGTANENIIETGSVHSP